MFCCTRQCQQDSRGLVLSLQAQIQLDVPGPLAQGLSARKPQARGLWLGWTLLLGLPTQQRNLGHEQRPGSEQQNLQGRAKGLVC